MITTIFFDVGGTLIHPDLSQLAAPLYRRVRPSRDQLAIAEQAAKLGQRRNGSGQLPERIGSHAGPVNTGYWKTYFASLLDAMACCHELLPELTARAGNSDFWSLVDPAAAPTLEALRRHYRLAVISNADGRIEQCLARGGLRQFFDKLIDSGLAGYEKPDPHIFLAAMEQMKCCSDESLYVGDIYDIDYEGPKAVGMAAVLLDPNGVYRRSDAPCLSALTELPEWIRSQQQNGPARV